MLSSGSPRLGTAAVLFASFFAAQAAMMTLSPILPDVARDLGVSLSVAGQLQTLAGMAGAAVAIAVTLAGARFSPRRLLRLGLTAIAAGSAVNAVAPSFAVLLGAEAMLGCGMAAVLAGGVAAVPAWTTSEERSSVLAWALLGQPGAWVIGMPLIGLVAPVSWRLGWIAVPLAASVAALTMLARHRAPEHAAAPPAAAVPGRAWQRPEVRSWALAELLAQAAWAGTLVYAGSLLHDRHHLGLGTVGVLLGIAAAAYFPGSLLAKRHVGEHARPLAVGLGLAAAAGMLVLGLGRPGPAVTVGLIALLMAVVGARGLAGSALGLQTAPDRSVEISGIRAAGVQLGALLGAAVGGLAIHSGGWEAWGATLGTLFVAGVLPYVAGQRLVRPAPAAA